MKWGRNLISLVVAVTLGLSLFLTPMLNRASPAQAQVTWTKSSTEVTLGGELYVVDAWVLWDETAGEYKMWYTHGKPALSLSEIASDLIALNLGDIINDIANLNLTQLLIDISALDAADLLIFLGDASTVIGYATSTDGLDWDIVKSEALTGSGGGAWNSVGAPSVIWDATANLYKMWYTNSKTNLDLAGLQTIMAGLADPVGNPAAARAAILDLLDGTSTVIGYATSGDGITWDDNPEVLAGSGSLLDSIGAPSVIQNSPTDYEMWYTQAKPTVSASALVDAILAGANINDLWDILNSVSTVIGYATSNNGIGWTVVDDEVLFGSGNLLDSVADPSVIKNSSTDYEMWYTNNTSNLDESSLLSLRDAIIALDLTALWDALETSDLSAFLTAFLALEISTIESLLDSTNTAIGYATSEDGETWTVEEAANLVGGSGTPPWSGVAASSVVKTGNSYEMWYTEGIDDITSLDDLTNLALGGDLPIGYASFSPSGGGGGGGGGGALILTIEINGLEYSYLISLFGAIMTTVERTTENGELTVSIPGGTVILTKDGAAPIELIITADESPPSLPDGAVIIGTAYSFKPNGVTFDDSMTLTFTYDPATGPQNVTEKDLVIAYYDLATGEWIELASVVDTEADTVTAEVSHLTTFAVLGYGVEVVVPPVVPPVIPPTPATFSINSLSISPDEVDIDEPVNISILVTNTGGSEGSYEVILKIDGVVEASEEVTVPAGADKEVTFTVSKDVVGTYSVEVSGLTGSFTVKEEVVPPPVVPPPVVPPPVVPPPVIPPVIPKQISWWLIGGIISGVIAIGMVIWQLIRQRA